MQLTMEPLDEMLASARVMDDAGMDTVWLAEAYPWWRKHQMEARSSTVVSALLAEAQDGAALVDRSVGSDGARDEAPRDRLGDHLAVDAPPRAGRDGRAGR